MACRSGILIDNFLEQSKFDALSAKVASSSTYTTSVIKDLRDDLFTEAYTLVFERLKEIGLYQEHFSESIKLFGYNQFRPSNEGYGNFNGLILIMVDMFSTYIQIGMKHGKVKLNLLMLLQKSIEMVFTQNLIGLFG